MYTTREVIADKTQSSFGLERERERGLCVLEGVHAGVCVTERDRVTERDGVREPKRKKVQYSSSPEI